MSRTAIGGVRTRTNSGDRLVTPFGELSGRDAALAAQVVARRAAEDAEDDLGLAAAGPAAPIRLVAFVGAALASPPTASCALAPSWCCRLLSRVPAGCRGNLYSALSAPSWYRELTLLGSTWCLGKLCRAPWATYWSDLEGVGLPTWNGHYCRCSEDLYDKAEVPTDTERRELQEQIEPWLSALIQSEHLSLLVGNGLTTATAIGLGTTPSPMGPVAFGCDLEDKVIAHAKRTAERSERGKPNLEDQLRTAQALIEGLQVSDADADGNPGDLTKTWQAAYGRALGSLVESVIKTERGIADKLRESGGQDASGLLTFLLSFASRPPTRERLEIFTTNYDRLIEHGCDLLGIRILDRFVGTITPQFRAARLSVDMHFDPPGIRGEPRYLEGVARLTKLHGSLDWRLEDRNVTRVPLPFGPPDGFPALPNDPYKRVMIYPNAAKDMETLAFPYAELFRDFAAALCRPNATLFIYGYGFGDDHVNRVIKEMLTISSTHVVIVSFNECDGRLETFCRKAGHEDQISLLVGKHFGDLGILAKHYLPCTLVEAIRHRRTEAKEVRDRERPRQPESGARKDAASAASGGVGDDHTS